MRKRVWVYTVVALLLFALDAMTKYWIQSQLPIGQYASPYYPYGGIGIFQDFLGIDFDINRVSNRGGAWGVFSSYPIALACLRIGIICALAIYTFFINKISKRTFPFLLILVGASGNIVDFFLYGGVIDMFHFVLWNYSFPVFNVADVLIFIGVSSLLIQALIEKTKVKRSYATQSSQS